MHGESGDLARMLRALNELPMPVIGRINGPAYGGGVGMISVCDITIAVDTGVYSLTEVRLGLLPANIAPYVVARMGEANARRTFLTARRMSATEARRLGLLSEVVAVDQLDAAVERELADLLQCAPGAVAATKKWWPMCIRTTPTNMIPHRRSWPTPGKPKKGVTARPRRRLLRRQ